MHRRDFLKTALVGGTSAALLSALSSGRGVGQMLTKSGETASQTSRRLAIISRSLEINKRPVKVFGLVDAQGRHGLTFTEGEIFKVSLANELSEPTIVHWHGLLPPVEQDGVPDLPMPMLRPGETRDYEFPVGKSGTYWMHAHTLQEQNLLAAPLIVQSRAAAARDEQEVVVLLHDFSFTPAEELLARLKGGQGHRGMAGHAMPGGQMQHMPMGGMPVGGMQMGAMDLNDIDYDAYLANDRTLDDPEVFKVENGGRVRLRIINGATATVFTIDTGELEGELIAVDGQDIEPLLGRRFPIAMGQRIDVRLTLPKVAKAFPVLALREGAVERTGFVLAPAGAKVAKIAAAGSAKGPVMGLDLEARLKTMRPLAARSVDRTLPVMLMGDMRSYTWSMPSSGGLAVRKGERVQIVMRNHSMMAHPMHLHGHHFQVVAINGKAMSGALRDTVQVLPMSEVTIAFDADNPGKWAFHCHHLYHMAAGMMAMVDYEGVG